METDAGKRPRGRPYSGKMSKTVGGDLERERERLGRTEREKRRIGIRPRWGFRFGAIFGSGAIESVCGF